MAATRLVLLAFALWAYSSPTTHGQPTSLTVRIVAPATGTLIGDALNVVVTIASTFEVTKAVAEVDGQQINLAFSSAAYSLRDLPMPGWTGVLSLSNLARGPKTLTVTAVDVLNNSAQAQVTFVHDRKPVLTVTAPLEHTVARPQVHLTASCTDDDPAGCNLTARVSSTGAQVAAGHNSIEVVVSLADYEGRQITLTLQATDTAGQTVSQEIPVYVESSQRLSEAATVTGAILDIEPDRILFREARTDRNVLKIRHRATDQERVVTDQAGFYPQNGYLTPKGAIFLEQSGHVLTAVVYDERDGTLADLGVPNSAQSLVAKGNYAIWSSGTTLIRRDLTAGTNTVISGKAGNWKNDVALDGDVVYWTSEGSYNIYRYYAGATTPLTADTSLWNVYPLTDGKAVVYRKQDPCCGQQRFGLFLHDGTREVELAPLVFRQEPGPLLDYQIKSGWVAFTRPGTGGQSQVWTRSPAGQETQLTFFGDSSRISALGPEGQVMFFHGRRYLSTPGQQVLDISSSLGTAFWQGDGWWITLGRSLFKVNTTTVPSMSDLFTTAAGQFGFQVRAAAGQTAIVQGSLDMREWRNLQTNAVAGTGFIFKDAASALTSHRFYRVVTP